MTVLLLAVGLCAATAAAVVRTHFDAPGANGEEHPKVVGSGLPPREALPLEELEDQKATGLPRIRIVRTWGDLLDQPVLPTHNVLKKGPEVRLGIETRHAPDNGGLLVYALVESPRDSARELANGHALGPLSAHLVPLDGQRPEVERLLRDPPLRGLPKAERMLFVALVQFPSAGRHRLEVRQPDGQAIAAAVITATKDAHHPWLALQRSGAELEEELQNRGEPLRERLALTTRPAAPRFDGTTPVLLAGGPVGKVLRSEALPRLAPPAPDPRLTLRFDGKTLDLRSTVPLVMSNPAEHLLCRWWVNGVSVRGGAKHALENLPERWLGRSAQADHIEIELTNLSELKARSGDRIAVQMLYCPRGWAFIDGGRSLREELKMQMGTSAAPLMTNKAEYVVP
jgi:hypothetical protein